MGYENEFLVMKGFICNYFFYKNVTYVKHIVILFERTIFTWVDEYNQWFEMDSNLLDGFSQKFLKIYEDLNMKLNFLILIREELGAYKNVKNQIYS